MKGWVGLVGWPCSGRLNLHRWSPISCRSSVWHGKFAGQTDVRSTIVPRNQLALLLAEMRIIRWMSVILFFKIFGRLGLLVVDGRYSRQLFSCACLAGSQTSHPICSWMNWRWRRAPSQHEMKVRITLTDVLDLRPRSFEATERFTVDESIPSLPVIIFHASIKSPLLLHHHLSFIKKVDKRNHNTNKKKNENRDMKTDKNAVVKLF